MKRDLPALGQHEFDLLVIGGGVFGAFAAWDASQRGLSVALIERFDFGGATSANSFKMIHGGIRYIQHGDVKRVRVSSAERRAFLRIAPHLVRPLRIAIPTFGLGMRGQTLLRVGTGLYDLLTMDRSRGLEDPARTVGTSKMMSRTDLLDLFPGLESQRPSGAAVITEGQMYNPPRLVLAVVKSASEAGAVVANYVEARSFSREQNRIVGVEARDHLAGDEFRIRARVVLNAAGPFAEPLLERQLKDEVTRTPFSRDACFVVRRPLTPPGIGLAVQGSTKDPDAVLSRGGRHLFLIPWHGHSLVGVWHKVYRDSPDQVSVAANEIESFLAEVNEAAPWLGLDRSQVSMVNAGLVPFGQNRPGAVDLKYGHRSRLIDHRRDDGLEGLVSLIGVRFTTGRYEAERAVNLVFRKLGRRSPRCRTAELPVWGGEITDFEAVCQDAFDRLSADRRIVRALVHNHGSNFSNIAGYCDKEPSWAAPISGSDTLRAEVVHAVREEMAEKLTDVVFRRTDLGTARMPSDEAVAVAADLMAVEKGWTDARRREEMEGVQSPAIPAGEFLKAI